ncbi:hypothetical protein LINGRAHAP2_LOCUS36446 [Linum grandiflorum]
MEKMRSKSFPQYSSVFAGGDNKTYSFNGEKPEGDREAKRKKRVAAYNVFTVEGKLKSSFRNGFKWIKTKFTTTDSSSGYGI